ncbi:MAG: hypothetical protein RR806_07645, partial [Oscillospiraceae bacterium]
MKIQKIISVALVIAMLAAQPLQNYTVSYAQTDGAKSLVQTQTLKNALINIVDGKLYLVIDSVKYVPYELKDTKIQFKSLNGVKCIQFTCKDGTEKCINLYDSNDIKVGGQVDQLIIDKSYKDSKFGFDKDASVKDLEVGGNSSVEINGTTSVEKVVANGVGSVVVAENAKVNKILSNNKDNITLPAGSTLVVEPSGAPLETSTPATTPTTGTDWSTTTGGGGGGGNTSQRPSDDDDADADADGDVNTDSDTGTDDEETTVNKEDEIATEAAYEALKFRNATGITSDITFQKTCKGCNLQWSSSDENVISNNGIVTRPKFGEPNVTLSVTATISKGKVQKTKSFDVTVLAMTDKEQINDVMKNLVIEADLENVVQDLTLPTEFDGAKITWSTLSPSYITDDGVITRPAWDNKNDFYEASLKATIVCGSVTDYKYFAMKILKEANPTVSDEEKVASAIKNLKINSDLTNVTGDIHLPTIMTGAQVYWDTADISWTSSDESIISNTGFVTRPAFGEADKVITLTASVTVGDFTDVKQFTATVKPITAKEKFDEIYKAFNLSNINVNEVKDNIILPTQFEGATISWASNNESVVSSTGTVVRPTGDDSIVKLTATIKLGEIQKTKTFSIKVLAIESPELSDHVKELTIITSQAEVEALDAGKIYDEVLIKNVNEKIDLSKITIEKLTFGQVGNFVSRAIRSLALDAPTDIVIGSVNEFDVNLLIGTLNVEKGNNKKTIINGNININSITAKHEIELRGKLVVPPIETNSNVVLNTELDSSNPIVVMKNSNNVSISGSIGSIPSILLSSDAIVNVPVKKMIEIAQDAPSTINLELNNTVGAINTEKNPVNSNIVLSGTGTLDWLYSKGNATLNVKRVNNILPLATAERAMLDGDGSIGSIILGSNANKFDIACTNVDEIIANGNVSMASDVKKLVANANDIVVKMQNDKTLNLLSVAKGVSVTTVEGNVNEVEILSKTGEVIIKLDQNVMPTFTKTSNDVIVIVYNKDSSGKYVKTVIDEIKTKLAPPVILYNNGHSKNRTDYKTDICDRP